VRLTPSPNSCAECHEIWEPKTPGTLWATPGLLRDSFTLLYLPPHEYVRGNGDRTPRVLNFGTRWRSLIPLGLGNESNITSWLLGGLQESSGPTVKPWRPNVEFDTTALPDVPGPMAS
jgi:hypothetical protein